MRAPAARENSRPNQRRAGVAARSEPADTIGFACGRRGRSWACLAAATAAAAGAPGGAARAGSVSARTRLGRAEAAAALPAWGRRPLCAPAIERRSVHRAAPPRGRHVARSRRIRIRAQVSTSPPPSSTPWMRAARSGASVRPRGPHDGIGLDGCRRAAVIRGERGVGPHDAQRGEHRGKWRYRGHGSGHGLWSIFPRAWPTLHRIIVRKVPRRPRSGRVIGPIFPCVHWVGMPVLPMQCRSEVLTSVLSVTFCPSTISASDPVLPERPSLFQPEVQPKERWRAIGIVGRYGEHPFQRRVRRTGVEDGPGTGAPARAELEREDGIQDVSAIGVAGDRRQVDAPRRGDEVRIADRTR